MWFHLPPNETFSLNPHPAIIEAPQRAKINKIIFPASPSSISHKKFSWVYWVIGRLLETILEPFHFPETVQVFPNPTLIYNFFQKNCKYDLVKPKFYSFCK